MSGPKSTRIDEGLQQHTTGDSAGLIFLLPNAITGLAVFAGLISLRMSCEGRYGLALASIIVAALLDGVDGRLARMLHATSRFGAELDSLADFLNFGVAPVVLLLLWRGDALDIFTWLALMTFALAAALRLARFNVHRDDITPDWHRNYFVGMPTPIAAVAVLLPIYSFLPGEVVNDIPPSVAALYTFVISFLMVSNIPTFSGKGTGGVMSQRSVFLGGQTLLLGLGATLVMYPRVILTAVTLSYLASIPFSWLSYRARSASVER